mmetsp:Transcript_22474/g.34652  ORF Transcript_22474/g.34652 Transcript_22474/m.34652 type:complete len:85 (+) Transcript_22474:91-345(+)
MDRCAIADIAFFRWKLPRNVCVALLVPSDSSFGLQALSRKKFLDSPPPLSKSWENMYLPSFLPSYLYLFQSNGSTCFNLEVHDT